jgi:hypothetical protein
VCVVLVTASDKNVYPDRSFPRLLAIFWPFSGFTHISVPKPFALPVVSMAAFPAVSA